MSITISSIAITSITLLLGFPITTHAIVVLPVAAPAITGAIFTVLLIIALPTTFTGLLYRFIGSNKKPIDTSIRFASYVFYHLILIAMILILEKFTPREIRVSYLYTAWQLITICAWGMLAPYSMYYINRLRGKETFEPNFYQGFRLAIWNVLITYLFIK